MADMIQPSRDYRTKLDKSVTAFSLFIHDLCPDARQEISFARYEDEDAHIWVTLPPILSEEERETFANRIAEKSLDILLAEDLLILAGVEEPWSVRGYKGFTERDISLRSRGI
jgi:hypothetical protein